MEFTKKLAMFGISAVMTLSCVACGGSTVSQMEESTDSATTAVEQTTNSAGATANQSTEQEADQQMIKHKIGVAVYSEDDNEVNMFRDYYRSYLEQSFSVEFMYSPAIGTLDDEKAFVDSAREAGCEGIISFMTTDLDEIVKYCGEDLYYVYGSGSFSQEEFDSASQYSNFLGVIGPSTEDEKMAGVNMIRSLGGENGASKEYLILSGGSGLGNYMHNTRTLGMLETLEKEYGFTFDAPITELASATENATVVGHTAEGGTVSICPGYLMLDGTPFYKILKDCNPDVIVSACNGASTADAIFAEEAEDEKDITVGVVDCFCEDNQMYFTENDQFGNSQLNYLEGKCGANACPAFVAMYNAVTGYKDVVLDNGKAFCLNQNFWNASSKEEYDALDAKVTSIFDNIYTTQDIMNVLGEYNPDASHEDFVAFTDQLEEN